MATLQQLAQESRDVLRPFGQTETLLYYALVAARLEKFLSGKLLAVKNLLPKGPMPSLLKRGSREEPLFAREVGEAVTCEFLQTRKLVEHLEDARGKLTPLQRKVWGYFLPRKLNELLYATNGESPGRPIERVFFDLDRGAKMTHEQAREAAGAFVEAIEDDSNFQAEVGRLLDGGPFAAWTGSSFHVFLFLRKPVPGGRYGEWFQYSKSEPLASYTGRWAAAVGKRVGFRIAGGHEKIPNAIVIDPSQTPSGKLCRVPLGSLHLKDALTVDGVSLPLEKGMLSEKGLTKTLREYTPRRLLDELGEWSARLPKKFQ
jgi:hypothetical protein